MKQELPIEIKRKQSIVIKGTSRAQAKSISSAIQSNPLDGTMALMVKLMQHGKYNKLVERFIDENTGNNKKEISCASIQGAEGENS